MRTASLASVIFVAAVAAVAHSAIVHGGTGGLLGGFAAAIALGSSSALALVLMGAAGSVPRRPAAATVPSPRRRRPR